jgi:hypothetical protein
MYRRIIIKKIKSSTGYRYFLKCLNCNTEFSIEGCRYVCGEGKFCSQKCHYQFRKAKQYGYPARKGMDKKCVICKKEFYVNQFRKDARFCSHKCYWISLNKGGFQHRGYWLILQPTHHRADNKGYVPRYVVVVEKILGRPLKRKEEVHHIDNKSDDTPQNLYLFPSHKEHIRYHRNFQYGNCPKIIESNLS